jgi:hypothetical protein
MHNDTLKKKEAPTNGVRNIVIYKMRRYKWRKHVYKVIKGTEQPLLRWSLKF